MMEIESQKINHKSQIPNHKSSQSTNHNPQSTSSGIAILHKPKGESSRATLNRLQRAVHSQHKRLLETLYDEPELLAELKLRKSPRVGHAGTLDPMAEGILVACVGEATKLIDVLQMLPKHYIGTFQLGVTSDTEDAEGSITALPDPPRPTLERLRQAASQFVGRIRQQPPVYSALKVDGQRAYKLAREGKAPELREREIDVYQIDVLEYEYPFFRLAIECGSGTYVRSLGRDIGKKLDSCAIMTALTRDHIGPFSLEKALLPSVFDDATDLQWLESMLPLETGVAHLPRVNLDNELAIKVKNGKTVQLNEIKILLENQLIYPITEKTLIAAFAANNQLLSLLEIGEERPVKIRRNFGRVN